MNRGKWQQILGEDRKVGEGGHAFEYDKHTKVHFVSEHFFAIMLNIETFLNCCQNRGIKCPDCYAPVLEYLSELYFYLYYMYLILLFGYHQTSLHTFHDNNTTNSNIKITIGRAIFLKNKK